MKRTVKPKAEENAIVEAEAHGRGVGGGVMGKKDRITAVKFCNGDCNHCAAINNRQVSLLMNTLLHIYGDEIEEIGNAICPNLCCCADCRIDDYCHIGDDDGKSLCVIDKTSLRLARAFKRKFKQEGM